MHLVRTVAPVLGLAVSAAAAFGDVTIIARHSELHDYYTTIEPLPPSYSDAASTDAIGPVTLTTPHGASFTSSVSNTSITAQLHGVTQYGGQISHFSSGITTTLDVVFQVTGGPVGVSILINGSSFPVGNTQLRLLNAANQVLFNSDNNQTITQGIPWTGAWTNALWTSTLAPGTYHITGFANGVQTYSAGGGSGGSGGGNMNVQITFTPSPGAAAALALLAPIAARRQRA